MSFSPLTSDYWDATCVSSLFDEVLPSFDDSTLLKPETDYASDLPQIFNSNQQDNKDSPVNCIDEQLDDSNVTNSILDELIIQDNLQSSAQDLLESLSESQSLGGIPSNLFQDKLDWPLDPDQNLATLTGDYVHLDQELQSIPGYEHIADSSPTIYGTIECPDVTSTDTSTLSSPNHIIQPIEPQSLLDNQHAELELPQGYTAQDVLDCFSVSESNTEILDFDVELLSPDALCAVITDEPLPQVTTECLDVVLSPVPSPVSQPVPAPVNTIGSELKSLLLASPICHTTTLSEIDADSDYRPESPQLVKKGRKRTSKIVAPYSKSKKNNVDKKERKKQQNKEAATRYREKKRHEGEEADKEFNKLEMRNRELKDKVENISREINYLKNLLADVRKAQSTS